jgi:hypothetical protein
MYALKTFLLLNHKKIWACIFKDSSVLRVFMRGWPGKGVDAHQGWAELFAP